MQFRNQIGEATPYFLLLCSQIQLKDQIGEATSFFLLLYSHLQLRNQLGEATPTFSITMFKNVIEESDRGSNSYFLYNYIHKCN